MLKILRKSFNLTSIKKLDFFIFFIVSFLYSITELLGIGLIVVFISFLFSKESDNKIYFSDFFTGFSNLESSNSFIFFVSLIFICFFIRFIISFFLKLFEANFKKKLTINLVTKTLKKYLDQSFEWYTSIGTNRLIINVIENCNAIVDVAIIRLFSCLTSFVILIAFVISVIFVDPFLVLAVILFMTFMSFFVYKIFSSKNKLIAKRQYLFFNTAYSFAKSALECFPVVKVLKKNNYFLTKFSENFKSFQTQIFEYEMIREFTKIFFEFIFIFIICLTLILGYIKQSTVTLNLEFLIFFSLIFLRSLPHFTLILNYFRDLRKIQPQLDSVVNVEFTEEEKNVKPKVDSFKKIEIRNISYFYQNNSNFRLNASLNIKNGEKVAFVGMSGSGKTTLAHLVLGLIKPKTGDVFIDGVTLNQIEANFMSYTPQNNFIVNDSFIKNISLSLDDESTKHIKKIIKFTAMEDIYNRFKDINSNYFGNEINLSSGEAQRLSISRGLYEKSKLMVLDEPTSNLDSVNEKKFLEVLNEFGKQITIIMITHKLKMVKNFDKICFLDKGKLIDIGTFKQLYKKNDKFKMMYNYQEFTNE
tara:strand:+ start:30989 stop:32749 length:1761 start_codon:yes stop_codon:yes gene_type:complete